MVRELLSAVDVSVEGTLDVPVLAFDVIWGAAFHVAIGDVSEVKEVAEFVIE